MSRLWARIARRLAVEAGYTLIELVIVISLSTVVVGVPMYFVVQSLNQQNVGASRTAAAAQEEVGVGRLTRDLRSAVPSTTTSFAVGNDQRLGQPHRAGPGYRRRRPGRRWPGPAPSPRGRLGHLHAIGQQRNRSREIRPNGVTAVNFSPWIQEWLTLGGSTSPYSATNPAYVGISVKVLDTSQLDGSASHAVSGIASPITLQAGVDLLNNSL